MGDLKVYKLNDYEWYITPWSLEKTLEWYNKEFEDDLTVELVEECDVYNQGMWFETNDEDDIEELGDSDEIIDYIKTPKGIKRSAQFGNLMRRDGIVYKYCSFKVVIEEQYSDEELLEPEVIATIEW